MAEDGIRDKWDRIYRNAKVAEPPEPARVLVENGHLLPLGGTALDLASGRGENALYLARRGLDTFAFDISGEAMAQLDASAARSGLTVRTEIRDVVERPPASQSFDVIVVSRFLERALAPALVAALKPAGLLFYQTFVRDKAAAAGPTNPAYSLAANELLDMFGDLRLVVYREEGRIGDLKRGFRNEALLVGQRVSSGRSAVAGI